MKNITLFLIIFLVSFFFIIYSVDARSGCCSHHGGVCGCNCCDGSSLSSTCAPYYPNCNTNYNYTPPPIQIQCPLNSFLTSYNKCACNLGYGMSTNQTYCIKLPVNTHAVSSNTKIWECDYGYAISLDKTHCIKIPENAHTITSITDVWLCDKGYIENNNSCILAPPPENTTLSKIPTTNIVTTEVNKTVTSPTKATTKPSTKNIPEKKTNTEKESNNIAVFAFLGIGIFLTAFMNKS